MFDDKVVSHFRRSYVICGQGCKYIYIYLYPLLWDAILI